MLTSHIEKWGVSSILYGYHSGHKKLSLRRKKYLALKNPFPTIE